ncbi:SdrD B-like domain-containing protein, partial [Leptothrix ochracea]|uniref:SdrD B-like domain-containing protein n=1 Tax=Leptothrix ochracea TaxID=735331 RepID=UPI00387EDACA
MYQDKNNNGVFEPAPAGGDVGLPGVTVTLTGMDDLGAAVNKPTTTAADGSYSFTGLRPGTYAVTETEPVGLLNGKTTAGSAGGTATPVTTVPSAITAIPLTAGSAATGYEFADLGGTSLSGRVYQDKNNNGVFEPAPAGGDVGLPGVTVTLTGTNDLGAAVNQPTTTAVDGSYSFTGLRPGTYSVTETEPAGLLNGKTTAGSAGGTATPVTTVPSAISAIALTAGSAATGYEFADLGGTSLSGRVYQDKNNNGVFEPAPAGGDVGLPGVTVTLTGTDDLGAAVNKPTTTAADGSYSFTGLRPGTYSVTETEPAGLLNGKTTAGSAGGTATPVTTVPSAVTAIALTAGSAATGYEFADLGGTSLSGRVYQDKNNNGVFEPAPAGGDVGLPGVTVTLTGTDDLGAAVNKPTTTAADGSYSFTGLRPGTYAVTETEPVGLLNGKTTAGSAGGTATPVITVPSAISGIALNAGSVVTGYEFAELPLTADLAVQKTHQPARFTVNQTGTYQIRVRNTGSAATVGAVTVQDRLPAGLSLAATP